MILETNNKKINLVYRTRNIVKVTNLLQGKNFEELYFKASNTNDIEALSKIIFVFAEEIDSGLSAFKSSEEVYDFIDNYKSENKKSYQDLFKEIAEDINEQGFFIKKMTEEELINKIMNLLGVNMEEIIKSSTEKAVQNIATEELKVSLG